MSLVTPLEELEGRLGEPLPVHERVKLLNEMAEQLHECDPARGIEVAHEAVELSRAVGDALGEAQALYCLGRNLYSQADYSAVFEAQSSSAALFHSLSDLDGEARCANLLGITYRQLSDYGRALDSYDAALQGFRATGDLKGQAGVLSRIGNVEIQLGNHGAALERFDKALEIRRDIGDNEGAGFDLNNAAFGRIQRARQLRAAGEADACKREAEVALRLVDRALAIARQFAYTRLEAFCLQTMGEARHQLGDHDEGLRQLRTALELFESMGLKDQAARVLRALSEVHEALGDLAGALSCIRTAGGIEARLRMEQAEMRARSLSTRRRLEVARMETQRYRRLAMEDALTGLANRRQLDERLDTFFAEARRDGEVLTVALADVDHFKGINDRFSRAVGDEVLRCMGEILRSHCREGDIAGRYGGEEFMLVFRGLDMAGSIAACERVRLAVEGCD